MDEMVGRGRKERELSVQVSSTSNIREPDRDLLTIGAEFTERIRATASPIFEYNGSVVVAMVGKNYFAIACDRTLGVQLQRIATDFPRISWIKARVFVGLSGLTTDF
ncbi:unnamed protein product [Eruca vesicaria subsp. sativa]|uniref:Uncharacterized protein n=1 Tax=Eruca vesicaria subsp. sativa TaxID=29727 RepID=A0ABC8IS42_ERUVS|nr:unnamed protein product [Eruca vesicaria subsp. sativa]